ncbi:MAG: hypothetical protein CMH55_03455 [Myxococcales bacterium]|nr:hypothetical protein [Myxococcales bacterium]
MSTIRSLLSCCVVAVVGCGPSVTVDADASTLTPRTPEIDATVWGTWITQHLDGGQAKTRPYPLLHLVFEGVSYDPKSELRLLPSAERIALLDERVRRDRLEVILAPSGDEGLPVGTPFGQSFGSDLCRAAANACTREVCPDSIRQPCEMDVALLAELSMPVGDELNAESEMPSGPAADHRGPLDRWEMELSEGGEQPGGTWLSGRLALEFDALDERHHGILALRFSVPLLPERMARCNLAQFNTLGPVDGWPCDGEGEAVP